MRRDDEHVQRYRDLRSWLDELVIFAEAVREELSPDSPLHAVCYDELTNEQSVSLRRLVRLTAYAQEQPQLFVGVLVDAQRRLYLDDWELEHHLRLDVVGVLRLALAPRPRADHEADTWRQSRGLWGVM